MSLNEASRRILIADDSEAPIDFLKVVLQDFSLEIAFSQFPEAVVDMVETSLQQATRPDIVIVDGLAGNYVSVIEMAQAVGVPHIIILSGTDLSKEAERLGVNFVSKAEIGTIKKLVKNLFSGQA